MTSRSNTIHAERLFRLIDPSSKKVLCVGSRKQCVQYQLLRPTLGQSLVIEPLPTFPNWTAILNGLSVGLMLAMIAIAFGGK